MSDDKSIFEPKEGFASGPAPKSPFAMDDSPDDPFASPADEKSPFAADDGSTSRLGPDDSKASDPFDTGEKKSPFGYEPPVAGFGGSPFGGSPAPSEGAKESPFAVGKQESKTDAASSSDADEPAVKLTGDKVPAPAAESPAPVAEPPALAASPAPSSSSPAAPAPASASDGASDSSSIRQLELRAIFGVDRELSESEMLQRSSSLPGIRHLARIPDESVGAIDGIKRVLSGLQFGGGEVALYCNNAPIEFIREGSVMLAAQNDGSFAPGVRETLMIVARELGRM